VAFEISSGTVSEPYRIAGSYVLPGSDERVHPDSPPDAKIPFPPRDLQFFVGAPDQTNYLVVGEAWNELLGRYIRPKCRIVDVGCSSGRTARFLAENPHVESYVGFDVVPEAVRWCQRFIAPATGGRFRFEHLDVYNGEYYPKGSVKPEEARFPVPDHSADIVFAASVFPHLLESTALRYFQEMSRVLVRRGLAILSVHTVTVPTLPYKGSEMRIDVFPPYFEGLASRHALVMIEHVGDVCGQDTYVYQSVL